MENLKSEHIQGNCPIHTATPDATQTGRFCRVWCGRVNSVGPIAKQVRCVSGLRRSASGGRTGSDCVTAVASTQSRQAATPSRQTAHTQRPKVRISLFIANTTVICSLGHGLRTFTAVPKSTQSCIPSGSLNRLPASAGVRSGISPLCVIPHGI